MKKITKELAVLLWLKENGTINPIEALNELGCFRLAAQIYNLKNKGHKITVKRITKKGRFGVVNFAEYHLVSEASAHG